ncbi:hypothetical protein J6590_077927 [Homalodisca vitripennis]|nr:hypothetical protein J6590_077927 [Homalodisca vitripennis]
MPPVALQNVFCDVFAESGQNRQAELVTLPTLKMVDGRDTSDHHQTRGLLSVRLGRVSENVFLQDVGPDLSSAELECNLLNVFRCDQRSNAVGITNEEARMIFSITFLAVSSINKERNGERVPGGDQE